MKSKRLGSKQAGLRRFRNVVLLLLCLLMPVYTISTILASLQKYVNVVSIIATTAILILIFVVIFGTSYHLLVTARWALSFREPTSMTRRVGIRSIWLAVINISLLGYGLILILNATVRWRDAKQAFGTFHTLSSISQLIAFCSCLVIFNHFQSGDKRSLGDVS